MKLADADKLAGRIAAEIGPFCERIEVAGSIRRRRAWVNDIDLVVLPAANRLPALRHRILERTTPVTDGPMQMITRLSNGVQLDVFFAQPDQRDLLEVKPSNFGSLLLCRTGSAAHNIFLVEHAKEMGLRWNPYWGVFDGHGNNLAAATELEIFRALKLEFIPPERRER